MKMRDALGLMGKPQGRKQEEEQGYIANTINGFLSGGAGVASGITGIPGRNAVSDYFDEVAGSHARQRDYDTIFSWDYLTNPSGLTYDVGNQLGSMAVLAPAAMALPETAAVGAATGAAGLLGRLGLGKAAQWAASEAGKKTIGLAARGALTAVPESASEWGQSSMSLEDKGDESHVYNSLPVFGKNMLTLPVSNALEYSLLGGRIFNPSADAGASIVKRAVQAPFKALPTAGANGLQNGIEELLQQTYQDQAEGNPVGNALNPSEWTPAQRKAFEVGLAGSVVVGGAAGSYRAMRQGRDAASGDKAVNGAPPDELDGALAMGGSVNIVDNMRALQGKISYYADDGTNCMRTIGMALQGTPFEGQINVDQAVDTAKEQGLLRNPGEYEPKPGDIAVVNGGNHAVMVTEKGGTIQNGASRNGVYESDDSPEAMFGKVDYYIESSAYGGRQAAAASIMDDDSFKAAQDYLQNFADTESDADKVVAAYDALKDGVPKEKIFKTAQDLGFKPTAKQQAAEQTIDGQIVSDNAQQTATGDLRPQERKILEANMRKLVNGQYSDYVNAMAGAAGTKNMDKLRQQAANITAPVPQATGARRTGRTSVAERGVDLWRRMNAGRDQQHAAPHSAVMPQPLFIPQGYYENSSVLMVQPNRVRNEVDALDRIKQANVNAADKSGYDWRKMELEKQRELNGSKLMEMAKENNVPMNRRLQADVKAGKPLAVQTIKQRLAERGVDIAAVNENIAQATGEQRPTEVMTGGLQGEADNKKAAGEGGESSKDEIVRYLKSLTGKEIVNKETGIVAKLGTKGINKMVSNAAINKSIKNGYNQSQHLNAAKNIVSLYQKATLTETRPDRKNDANVSSIKRFHAPMILDEQDAQAKITVKESYSSGHRIYSVELEELEKPAELKKRTDTTSSAGPKGSTRKGEQVSTIHAEEPLFSDSSIPQSQEDIQANTQTAQYEDQGASTMYDFVNDYAKGRTEIRRQAKEKRFDGKRAESALDKLIGRKKKAEDQVADSKRNFVNIVDESELDAEIAKAKAELSKLSANSFFNPSLMKSMAKIGMIYLQKGVNNFANWSANMVGALGNGVKPFLKSVWNTLQAYPEGVKFNDDIMTAVMEYVGNMVDEGNTLEQIKKGFAEQYGDEYLGYVDSACRGIWDYPTEIDGKNEVVNVSNEQEDDAVNSADDVVQSEGNGGENNEFYDSADAVAERAGEGDNQDAVGRHDEVEGTGTGGKRSVSSVKGSAQSRSGGSVHGYSADNSGAVGDSGVRAEKSSGQSGSAGDTELSRGVRDSLEGQALLDGGATGRSIRVAQDGRNDGSNSLKEKSNTTKIQAGDSEQSVRNDLPMLLPEQQDDVIFAEKRLLANERTGVLFTNGTGTGKTFTGLGVVKRFVNRGKENILIVTPNDKISSDWQRAAKEYFGIDISGLKDTKDNGKGVTVTTYANFGQNDTLARRDWDLIVVDESQELMKSESAAETSYLKKLRALTYHHKGLVSRAETFIQKERNNIQKIKDEIAAADKAGDSAKSARREEKLKEAVSAMETARQNLIEEWQLIEAKDKPKTVMLSATPFAYAADVDYAEGYLFDYDLSKEESRGYNQPDGKEAFFIDNFGYRMRYGKLTKPDADVNTGQMEIMFHEKLRQDGALSGRTLTVDHDYDRGFILVDGGIGRTVDEGLSWFSDRKNGDFRDYMDVVLKQYKYHVKRYLLEAVKAKAAIPLIDQYLKNGKKVVVFHDFKKGGGKNPFVLEPQYLNETGKKQYEAARRARPDLFDLRLDDLDSPIETFGKAFGDKALIYNGDVGKSVRQRLVNEFQDDSSGKNLILVQSDAGQAGISLHDTTGNHPRVLINLGMPTKPVAAIQIEGRIYRTGQRSNAVFRYLNTGTNLERGAFAATIAERASTAENLALGREARSLKDSFIEAFNESDEGDGWQQYLPGSATEGTGGKERDSALKNASTDYDKAKALYFAQRRRTAKNKSSEGKDYFATPEPLGLKMVEWANLQAGESVLEPSAGHGAIARWFPVDTKNTAIEPSGKLAPKAQMAMQSGSNVINSDFESHNIVNKYNAVVMNPPFGAGGKTAIEHVAKAFRHLRDGGRIVAIIPDGSSCQKHLDKWLYGNESAGTQAERDAYVRQEILLPGVTFARAGTKVNCKVIVLDKQETPTGKDAMEPAGRIDMRDVKTIGEMFDRMENIELPKRYKATGQGTRAVMETAVPGAGTGKFDIDRYRHSKTGEMIPRAVFRERVDDFKGVSALAKRHGGYYSRYAKGFLFKEEAGRERFVKEADALLAGGGSDATVKFSAGKNHELDKKPWAKIFALFDKKERAKWNDYGKEFRKNVQEALEGRMRGNKPVKVCDTPLILRELGVPDLPIKMRIGIAANTTKPEGTAAHAHDLTLDMLEQIPQALNEPVFVLKSATNAGDIVVFTDVKDAKGRSVIVPLSIQKDIGHGKVANVIKTIYGRNAEDLFITKQMLAKNVLYANTEKSFEWLEGFRLQLSDGLTKQSSLLEKSIAEKLLNVNNNNPTKYSAQSISDSVSAAEDIISESTNFMPRYIADKYNLTAVDDAVLSSKQRGIVEYGEALGEKIVFFDGDKNIRGFHTHGTTFLNRKGNAPLQWVFWHETFHWMRNNNNALYQDLVDHIHKSRPFRAKQIEAYRDTIVLGREQDADGGYLMSDDDVIEEMLADRMPEVAERLKLNKILAKSEPSLYERFVTWINGMLHKLKAVMRGTENDPQVNLMVKAFKRMARDMRDAQGEHIFTVNKNGNLELVRTGREIASDVKIGGAAVAYSADHELNPTERRAAQLRQLGYSRNELMDILVDEYQDENYDPSPEEYRPGFAQHKELTEKWLIDFEVDVKKHLSKGISYETIEKQLFQRYNQTKGFLNENVGIPKIVNEMARMKGVMWHGRRLFKNDIERNDNDERKGQNRGLHESVQFQISGRSDGTVLSRTSGAASGRVVSRFLMGSEAWRKEQRRQGKSEDILRPPDKAAFSMGKDKASIGERQQEATKELAQKVGLFDSWLASPSRIAKKVPGFKLLFEMANRAMDKQEKMRADYMRRLDKAFAMVKDDKARESLYEILWRGDMETREWTRAELIEEGVGANVADAYVRVRSIMKQMYEHLNNTRRGIQTQSKNVNQKKLDELKANPLIEILSTEESGDDEYLVTWKGAKGWERTHSLPDKEALEEMLKRFADEKYVHVISSREIKHRDGTMTYEVRTYEVTPDINRPAGYIPHFFHDYFIKEKTGTDEKTGEDKYTIVGSGRNLRDANEQIEELMKKAPDKVYVVEAKQFGFDGEAQQAAVIGDKEYERMVKKLAKDNTMSWAEVKKMLNGSVKLKGRHRFYGNMLRRKGVAGFEKDMNWVLRHYINGVSRYVALESEFKPKAISLFERFYGRFDKDHVGDAKYAKDYINDINGNPSALEIAINDKLNGCKWWREYVVSNFGERGALQLASTVSGSVAILKLGMLNISSAMLNFSQLVNTAALIGDVPAVAKGIARALNPSMSDKKIMVQSGVLNDIGLDSGSGYGKLSLGSVGSKSMWFFKRSEQLVRRATILASYDKARSKGKNHQAALEFAQGVNRQANFEYGVHDAPNVFRRSSIIGQLLLQFKKYAFKETELMADMLSKSTDNKQKFIFWGGYFLLAGLMQIPALDWFDDIIKYFFGSSAKLKIKEAMMAFAGDDPVLKPLVKVANYGIGSLANIDASYRAGMADVVPKMDSSLLLGPAGGTVVQTTRNMLQGEFLTALKMFSPGLANIAQAAIGESKQARGRTNTRYDDLYDRVLRGIGFRSVDEAVSSDIQSIVSANRKEKISAKQEAIDAFLEEPTGENARRLRRLGVTPKQVRDERRRKRMTKGERTQTGLSRSEAREYRKLMRFGQ